MEFEDAFVDLEWNDTNVRNVGKRTLIRKIMTNRKLNRVTVKSMILKGWNPKKEVKIIEEEDGVFLFSFEDNADCGRVLRDRPWLIMGFLLLIQEREDFIPIKEIQWKWSLYWIQVHGIPIEGFTVENIVKIDLKIGEVIEFENPIVNRIVVRSFLRIRVRIDVHKPIVGGFWISRPGLGRCWIRVRYEKLQIFCHVCGVISHDGRDCGKERAASVVNPEESRVGGWNGAIPCKTSFDVVNMAELTAREAISEVNEENRQEVCHMTNVIACVSEVNKLCAGSQIKVEKIIEVNNCAFTVSEEISNLLKSVDYASLDMVGSWSKDVVIECMNEDNCILRISQRRWKVRNGADILPKIRTKIAKSDKVVCKEMEYLVEFPVEEDEDGRGMSTGCDYQDVLMESFNEVSLRRMSGDDGDLKMSVSDGSGGWPKSATSGQ